MYAIIYIINKLETINFTTDDLKKNSYLLNNSDPDSDPVWNAVVYKYHLKIVIESPVINQSNSTHTTENFAWRTEL